MRDAIPIEDLLVENSNYNRGLLKKRLINLGLLQERCALCNQQPVWQDRSLILQLDHLNGKSKDNRLENLRLLCPNCHSQTSTFAGKNKNTAPKVKVKKVRVYKTKINWPAYADLLSLVEARGYSGTGRFLGVSDKAVRKRLKSISKT